MRRNLSDLVRHSEEMKRTSRILEIVQIVATAPQRYLAICGATWHSVSRSASG